MGPLGSIYSGSHDWLETRFPNPSLDWRRPRTSLYGRVYTGYVNLAATPSTGSASRPWSAARPTVRGRSGWPADRTATPAGSHVPAEAIAHIWKSYPSDIIAKYRR